MSRAIAAEVLGAAVLLVVATAAERARTIAAVVATGSVTEAVDSVVVATVATVCWMPPQ